MNFGVATGRFSRASGKYLVVVDVDSSDHPVLRELPETFSYRTGSGGHHLWYWSTVPVRNSVSRLADKVDIRGLDGYVVVPPSRNGSGTYCDLSSRPIVDLPTWIMKRLTENKKQRLPPTGGKTCPKKNSNNQSAGAWVTSPVPAVRALMASQLVPEGVRNTVLHRLLSSDRAKGALKPQLVKAAKRYVRTSFENPGSVSLAEIESTVQSVIRYPAYNNSHERVNEIYVSWLKKHKAVDLSPAEVQHLKTADDRFFGALRAPDSPSVARYTLQEIGDARKAYIKTLGCSHVSTYKPQLLAKKLMSLGFKRVRTASRNTWAVTLPQAATVFTAAEDD